jgi:hypothetical protein
MINTYGLQTMDIFDYYHIYTEAQTAKRLQRVESVTDSMKNAMDPRKNKSHPLADKKWGSNLDVRA